MIAGRKGKMTFARDREASVSDSTTRLDCWIKDCVGHGSVATDCIFLPFWSVRETTLRAAIFGGRQSLWTVAVLEIGQTFFSGEAAARRSGNLSNSCSCVKLTSPLACRLCTLDSLTYFSFALHPALNPQACRPTTVSLDCRR